VIYRRYAVRKNASQYLRRNLVYDRILVTFVLQLDNSMHMFLNSLVNADNIRKSVVDFWWYSFAIYVYPSADGNAHSRRNIVRAGSISLTIIFPYPPPDEAIIVQACGYKFKVT
jgi:hypothetical protein